jgi:hypothetical protein
MILAVSGICTKAQNEYKQNFNGYQRKFYQPTNKIDLERKVGQDFEKVLSAELNKYHIDVII